MKRGNIACHKSEARFGTLLREGRLASRAFRDEAFWRSQVNFGPPNPATDEKALWYGVKGSVYVVTLPAFQRCLKDGPDAAERRPGSGFPTGRGTGDGHLEAHHDLQATPARPGKATRLGVIGSQRIHSTCSLPDFIFIIFESGGKGSLFCNGKKRSRFDSAQPNDSSNTNDLCLECVARSLL